MTPRKSSKPGIRGTAAVQGRTSEALRLGVAAFKDGNFEEALQFADSVRAREQANSHASLLAGMCRLALRQAEPAIALLEEAVRHNAALLDGHLNLGVAYWLAGRLEDAAAALRRAIAVDAGSADAHANLGMVLRDQGDFVAAEEEFRRAIAIRPGHHELIHSLAFVTAWLGRGDEASRLDDRAVALAPRNPEYRFDRGIRRLSRGRFADGWRDLESRWDFAKSGSHRRDFPQATWRGEDLSGKRILVWGEQGIGDHLFHACQLGHLGAAGAGVTFETDARLVDLLRRSLGGIETVPATDPPVPATQDRGIAFQIPLASVPLHMPDWPAGFYPLGRWLVPDPSRRAAIAKRIASMAAGRKTVGLSWRSQRAQLGPHKSMPLVAWAPILARPNTLFVALQYGDIAAEVEAAREATGADIYADPEIDRFNDLEGLVALIDSLDVVVTTSNVTVHFAGALGKPTLLALHHLPLWYWFPAFHAYRSVERFRQAAPGEWAPVVERVAARLDELLA